MQDDVGALFAYDRWANRKVLDACRMLTAEQYIAEPVPGWSSVRVPLTGTLNALRSVSRHERPEADQGDVIGLEVPCRKLANVLNDRSPHRLRTALGPRELVY